jgi:hypothetical protein
MVAQQTVIKSVSFIFFLRLNLLTLLLRRIGIWIGDIDGLQVAQTHVIASVQHNVDPALIRTITQIVFLPLNAHAGLVGENGNVGRIVGSRYFFWL